MGFRKCRSHLTPQANHSSSAALPTKTNPFLKIREIQDSHSESLPYNPIHFYQGRIGIKSLMPESSFELDLKI